MKLLKNIAISDSGLLFNPSNGESFSTNPIGLEIIKMIRSGKKEQEICMSISANYATEHAIAERDLLDFIHLLKQFQLADTIGG